jgi:hypothetical protein
MGDIFDDIMGGADEGPLTQTAAPRGGILVVAEKAAWAPAMHISEAVYRHTAHIPQVVFESVDPDTGETIFDNELDFRRAMDSLTSVSVEAAMAWSAERVGAVFEAHHEELQAAEIGEVPAAPGPGAVPTRTRKPHSTGHVRNRRH